MVVDGGGGEQRRHGHPRRPRGPVGEDEDVRPGGERRVGVGADPVERRLQPVRAVGDRPGRVDRVRLEDVRADVPEPLELAVAEDRVVDHELPRVLRRLVEQVALRADARLDAHHDRLADRVDRRVRHLREQLLEVRVEERLAPGEHRERRVVPHRADRLLAVAGERREDHLHVLLRVAEQELAAAQRLGGRLRHGRLRQVGEANGLALDPLRVRPARRDPALDLVVRDDPVLGEVDEEQLAGLEPALADDVRRRLVEHAGLGGEHDPAVGGLEPAAGPEPVAVERRADHAAVGERDRGRPVPRLHQALVVRVEPLQLVREVVASLVRLGDHHHHRVRERAAREHEQLEHVVEDRRVRAALADHRQHLREVVAEQLGRELRLARAHPVDVAAQRVDLAVVGDHPVRVRERPARERVRREARVDQREGALEPRVRQVGEEAGELRRGEHPLVDERAGGEARDDELLSGGALGDAPDDVELPLEGVLVGGERGRGADDQLAHARDERRRRRAGLTQVDRDVAPAEQLLPLRGDRVLDELLDPSPPLGVVREEARADPVGAGPRQPLADLGAEERIRDLEEDAGAVARVGVGSLRAAVLEVRQRPQRPLHRLVARDAVQPRDEGDAAGVVLEGRVVEARCGRLLTWSGGRAVGQRQMLLTGFERKRSPLVVLVGGAERGAD